MSTLVCLVSGVLSALGRADQRRVLLIPALALGSIASFWASGSAQQPVGYGQPAPVLRGEIARQVPDFPSFAHPSSARPMFGTLLWPNFVAVLRPSRPEDPCGPFQPGDPNRPES